MLFIEVEVKKLVLVCKKWCDFDLFLFFILFIYLDCLFFVIIIMFNLLLKIGWFVDEWKNI